MTDQEIAVLAQRWIAYWHAPRGSAEREQFWDASSNSQDLIYDDPESLWRLILTIHHADQSVAIAQVLSAGPIEDLLAKHGETFIDRVESEARRDPSFASVLGGVWKNTVTDVVWQRLQAVWDRRGWDGAPE